jgi:hypothetical protein
MYWPPTGFAADSSNQTKRAGCPFSIWLRSNTMAAAPDEVSWPVGNSFADM